MCFFLSHFMVVLLTLCMGLLLPSLHGLWFSPFCMVNLYCSLYPLQATSSFSGWIETLGVEPPPEPRTLARLVGVEELLQNVAFVV